MVFVNAQLFGFLNPLVQRLFRELVSSQGGEAHQSDEVYEAFSQNRGEMKRERKAVEHDESKAFPTNLSWQSTKTLSVRKSRTSIVSSSKYMVRLVFFSQEIIYYVEGIVMILHRSNNEDISESFLIIQFCVTKPGNSKLMTVSSERSHLQSEPGTCKTAAKDTLGCSPLEVSMCRTSIC